MIDVTTSSSDFHGRCVARTADSFGYQPRSFSGFQIFHLPPPAERSEPFILRLITLSLVGREQPDREWMRRWPEHWDCLPLIQILCLPRLE